MSPLLKLYCRICWTLYFLMALALLSSFGQPLRSFPDCCTQAIRLQHRVDTLQARIDSLKAIGTRLIRAKELRLTGLESQANGRIRELTAEINGKDLRLNLARAELKLELLRFRLFGMGRRRWASGLLKKLD